MQSTLDITEPAGNPGKFCYSKFSVMQNLIKSIYRIYLINSPDFRFASLNNFEVRLVLI